MSRTILMLALTLVSSAAAQTRPTTSGAAVNVTVDPRVELMCIVFRLAGNREYNATKLPGYARDIDEHFARFREHRAVQFAREMGQKRGVGYDAPMSLAVLLTDVQPLQLASSLEPWPAGLDRRWTRESVETFVPLLRSFVEETKFIAFMDAHADFYRESISRMQHTLDRNLKLSWFDAFFGPRQAAEFNLVLGLCNGTGNYGCRATLNGREHLYAVIGAWSADRQGLPNYRDNIMPTVIHEFCHSYCNPLIDSHYNELADAGERLFAGKEVVMRPQAYSSGRTVLYETLVRGCVARYRFEVDGPAAGAVEVLEQRLRGFGWVGELATLLAEYEAQRDRYPTPDAFMPRVAEFLSEYASRPRAGVGPP